MMKIKNFQHAKNLRFLSMNKKGVSVLMVIFELLVVVVVLFGVAEAAVKIGSSERVLKKNLANELSLMVNGLLGIGGEGVVAYPYDVSKYTVLLTGEEAVVFIKGEGETQKTRKKIFVPEGYKIQGSLEEKQWLCLEKKEKRIRLRECGEGEK